MFVDFCVGNVVLYTFGLHILGGFEEYGFPSLRIDLINLACHRTHFWEFSREYH